MPRSIRAIIGFLILTGILMIAVAIVRQLNDGKTASEQVLPELAPDGFPYDNLKQ